MRFVAKKKDLAQNGLDGYFLDMEKALSNSQSDSATTPSSSTSACVSSVSAFTVVPVSEAISQSSFSFSLHAKKTKKTNNAYEISSMPI